LPGSTVPALHGAIAPSPLPAKSKIHSGLDGDPVSSGIKVNWRRNSNAKGAAIQRIRHRNTLLGQCARQADIVGIETHIETAGRTGAVEVHTINVDGFDRPSFAVSNNEIVCQLICENIEFRLKILRRRGSAPQVVVLVVEDGPRKIRRHQDRN
jgi:hypothetical protein